MIKKLLCIFSLVIPSPTIWAMEEEPPTFTLTREPTEKMLNYTQLRSMLSLLAQQEELRQALEHFARKAEIFKNSFLEMEALIKKSSIIELLSEQPYIFHFKNIKDNYPTMIIIRNRDFIEKEKDFGNKDKLLAERLSKSSNKEVREIGELKKLHIKFHDASVETELALKLLLPAIMYFKLFISEAPAGILNLLAPGRLSVSILPGLLTRGPKAAMENLKKIEFVLLHNYPTSYDKFEVKKTYAEGIARLKQLTEELEKISKLENLPESETTLIRDLLATGSYYISLETEAQSKPLPDTLDDVIWKPTIEEIKELPIKKEEPTPKKKPARKPRKKEPTRKPEKPIEEVAPEIPEEVEAEVEEEIEVEEVEPTYPELATWFNDNFKAADGSSVSFIGDYQIIIEDPKNNAQIVLYRKSQDDKKIITPPLSYIDRVQQWFTDPQKALHQGSYTAKIKTRKKLDEMAGRHNFAQMTDAFIDKEGVSETHIDEKKRKIPVKLLAGELRLKQPDGSVETISGIFSYGKLPKANKYYHRYLHEKEYSKIAQEYYADAKWQVDFPPLA